MFLLIYNLLLILFHKILFNWFCFFFYYLNTFSYCSFYQNIFIFIDYFANIYKITLIFIRVIFKLEPMQILRSFRQPLKFVFRRQSTTYHVDIHFSINFAAKDNSIYIDIWYIKWVSFRKRVCSQSMYARR